MNTGFTLWMTGMSGTGKSTLSHLLEQRLRALGAKVEILDGDVVRTHLSKGLGFSKEDREENIRRIGFVCELLSRNGVIAIAAAISPYRAGRDELRKRIPNFFEVYMECPVEVLIQRDVKGLYKHALAGDIPQFTGISDPYEPPLSPEVTINSSSETPEQSVERIMTKLKDLGWITVAALMLTGLAGAQEPVSFPTGDGGVVHADVYGKGDRGVVLAHGARFEKSSWAKQAQVLAKAGFRTVAIDFRGYGQSKAGKESSASDMYQDVLAAVRYLHTNGAKTVSVVGASMGGGASARAAVEAKPGEIDRLVLLAAVPIQEPERMKGRKLFITSGGDQLAEKVRDQYNRAADPKELLVLEGSAHAQNIFPTEQGERLMQAILQFLSAP